ncbi:MAG: hypothetical protein DRJ57_00445 [Thermoprotei archaeon]|nr:MAG: hypothetical protein DRJ57_00445 [Thermoprotei archaeon]
MSWRDVVRRSLGELGVSVEESRRCLIARSPDDPHLTVAILQRRLHMSLDRKVEMIGVIEVARDVEGAREVLRRMLEESFEAELKGIFRKTLKMRSWRELKYLEGLCGPLRPSSQLLEAIRADEELMREVMRAAPDMIEVFPELISPEYMEVYMTASHAAMGPLMRRMIARYMEEPERLAWYVRLHFMYGLPRMGTKVKRNYRLLTRFGERLRNFTRQLF